MGVDYSFELISIETYAPQFIGYNKLFQGSVCIEYWSNKIKKERAALCTNIVKVVMGLKVNIPGFPLDPFRE